MQQLTRSWPGLASSGAALLYAAVGAGVVVSATQPLSLAIGVILIVLACLHGVWSVAAFRSGLLVRPGLGLILFLAPLLVWALALFTPGGGHASHGGGGSVAEHPASIATASIATVPMASAVLLGLLLAISCGVRMRRPGPRRAPAASGASFMVGLVLGGLVISALVTPALAASDAGELAVPHGTHSAH